MTGRKGRVVSTKDGVQYESRSEVDVRLEILNLTEKQRFMDGEKVGACFMLILTVPATSCSHGPCRPQQRQNRLDPGRMV